MSTDTGRILIIDDDEDVLLAARMLLKQHYKTVHTEKDPAKIPTFLKNEDYDVILLDMNFSQDVCSGKEGFYWLNQILETDPSAIVIFITAFGDVEKAVQAIKEGATDFVLKPWQNEKLLATVSAAMKLRYSKLEAEQLRSKQQQLSADMDFRYNDIIGKSKVMEDIFATIGKVAKTDANVLILGENGTGKELVARALHRQSGRASEVFISVDMGAISESLFESELFGHVKGAFTDARENRAGRFEIASGGTLFLDEIGNLSQNAQAKLLTALQNRQIHRIGSNKPIDIDIRLICATNKPIHQLTIENKFRQDLLYRINTVEINLPPLRERREDIPILVEHFTGLYSKKYNRNIKGIAPATIKKLETYQWPGNIRELQHSIERAVILSEADVIQPTDFFFASSHAEAKGLMLDNYNLETIEKIVIQKTLKKHAGNISHAAEELGLTRAALYRRMEKYDI
jgi:two-component system response regulator HydG